MCVHLLVPWPCLLLHSLEQDSGRLLSLPMFLDPDTSAGRSLGHSPVESSVPAKIRRHVYLSLRLPSVQCQWHSTWGPFLQRLRFGVVTVSSFLWRWWGFYFSIFHSFTFLFGFRGGSLTEVSVIFMWFLCHHHTYRDRERAGVRAGEGMRMRRRKGETEGEGERKYQCPNINRRT